MRKLNRYIFTVVFGAIGLTLLVFMSLDFIFSLINQLDAVRGNYTSMEALLYLLLTLPRRLYSFMPFACLIGCLAGVGILASSSELVIMRAAGVSTARIVWMALRPALVFIFIALLIGEYVTPYTEQLATNRRAIAIGESVKPSQQQTWNREGNEFIHFDAVLPNGIMYGVSRYQFNDEHKLVSASRTNQAIYQNGFWQEEDIAITHLEGNATRVEKLATRRWDTRLTPDLLNILVLEPKDLSIRNLHYYINYLDSQNIKSDDYALSFWQKILGPLATVSLVLIAISFIFGPLRSVTTGQRIFIGVLLGVSFEILQRLLGPSSLVFGFSPLFAVLVPILLCIGIGVYLLRQAR
ncbi:MAG TPA: LPS export ABC transporter permease LptG [Cellvibrio sp.]|nr:LPS export ABC transporter permease LptG [Cellvibrio sp.]